MQQNILGQPGMAILLFLESEAMCQVATLSGICVFVCMGVGSAHMHSQKRKKVRRGLSLTGVGRFPVPIKRDDKFKFLFLF